MALSDLEASIRIARMLDGIADGWELDALAAAAREDPRLLQQLRQQMAIDEVLSQLVAPERAADAFLAGLEERQRIDDDAAAFTARVLAAARTLPTEAPAPAPTWLRIRPVLLKTLGSAAALIAVALLGLLISHLPTTPPGLTALATSASLAPGAAHTRVNDELAHAFK